MNHSLKMMKCYRIYNANVVIYLELWKTLRYYVHEIGIINSILSEFKEEILDVHKTSGKSNFCTICNVLFWNNV